MEPTIERAQLASRLTNLESLFTHLERQAAELSKIVLAQQQRLDQIERRLDADEENECEFDEPPS